MIEAGSIEVSRTLARTVETAGYAALLGYPTAKIPPGPASELAERARSWYDDHGRPWAYVRPIEIARVRGSVLELATGGTLAGPELARRARAVSADCLVLAVVSAGIEVDREVDLRWSEERPDESYALDRFGAAVAIRLGRWLADHLRTSCETANRALGPGCSPGHDGWPLTDQTTAVAALFDETRDRPPGFGVHESGMLVPKNSLLAAFALGRDPSAVAESWALHRCSWCSAGACDLRGRQRP